MNEIGVEFYEEKIKMSFGSSMVQVFTIILLLPIMKRFENQLENQKLSNFLDVVSLLPICL